MTRKERLLPGGHRVDTVAVRAGSRDRMRDGQERQTDGADPRPNLGEVLGVRGVSREEDRFGRRLERVPPQDSRCSRTHPGRSCAVRA